MIRELNKTIYFLLAFIYILNSCSGSLPVTQPDAEQAGRIFEIASDLVANKEFKKAMEIYAGFLSRYPLHEFADDAAYRTAYLHVYADEMNPYLDYNLAKKAFTKFVGKYPESEYLPACKNWIKVLNLTGSVQAGEKLHAKIRNLEAQSEALQIENRELKKSLNELEKAIQRE